MRLNNKFYQINYAGLFGDVNYDGAFDILESIRIFVCVLIKLKQKDAVSNNTVDATVTPRRQLSNNMEVQ